jgi:hypothetical protein
LASIKWEGDTGFNFGPHTFATYVQGAGILTDGSYTSGQHTKGRTFKLLDSAAITSATGIGLLGISSGTQLLSIKPNAGTITKPSGYWAALTFQLYWTRAFSN